MNTPEFTNNSGLEHDEAAVAAFVNRASDPQKQLMLQKKVFHLNKRLICNNSNSADGVRAVSLCNMLPSALRLTYTRCPPVVFEPRRQQRYGSRLRGRRIGA